MPALVDQIEDHLPFADDDAVTEAAWKGLTLAAGVLSAILARRLVAFVWTWSKGSAEPVDPGDRDLDWSTALQWAIASGVGVGVARLVGQRVAAAAWERATGSRPPGANAESALRR